MLNLRENLGFITCHIERKRNISWKRTRKLNADKLYLYPQLNVGKGLAPSDTERIIFYIQQATPFSHFCENAQL